MKMFFLFTIISTLLHLALSQNDCLPTSCSPTGPTIRFPFRLKDRQPAHCGYPGFELSCNENGITKFDLQFPVTASTNNTNSITLSLRTIVSVWDIDYIAQKLQASNAKSRSCLPEKNSLITTLNTSKLEVEALGYNDGYTLFNCSDTRDNYEYQKINCLSGRGYEVITFASFYDITSLPPYSSCFKMYNISYVPENMFVGVGRDDEDYGGRFNVRWREPSCGDTCEKNGKYCRLRNGGDGDREIECFEDPQRNTGASRSHKTLIKASIITTGLIILLLITIASYFILGLVKRNHADKKKLEKLLSNHKGNMMPKRHSYTDIKKITCNFKNEGVLVDGTRVFAKTFDGSDNQNVEDFITEVETIGQLQHANVLQLIGYCVDRRKWALIYESTQNQTLENLVMTLDDKTLHRVALGVAKGIDYVCRECDGKILNMDNISPRDILLDDNLDVKILVYPYAGISEDVSKKTYVFRFGMLLLEVLGRRRNLVRGIEKGKNEKVYYLPEWIYNNDEMEMGDDEENEIVKKLSIVGLWCIQWFPSDRPSMKCVVQMLEIDRIPIMPPNPFDLKGADK